MRCRPLVREVCDELDEHLLIPGEHPVLTATRVGTQMEIRYRERRYLIPAEEVIVLPIGNTSAEIARLYSEYGLPMFGVYHDLLNTLGIPAYRILVFLCYLASAVCLWAILGKIPEVDRRTAFLLLVFFVLFPSNSARISIMASRTSACSALFFVGLWALTAYLDSGKLRIAAGIHCVSRSPPRSTVRPLPRSYAKMTAKPASSSS